MNKRVLLIVFMLLAFTSLYAQEGSITGYVVDTKKAPAGDDNGFERTLSLGRHSHRRV